MKIIENMNEECDSCGSKDWYLAFEYTDFYGNCIQTWMCNNCGHMQTIKENRRER